MWDGPLAHPSRLVIPTLVAGLLSKKGGVVYEEKEGVSGIVHYSTV